jgi:hypothetical protein
MSATTGVDLGVRLCKTFGLNPGKVKSITIFIDIGDTAMVRADMLMTDTESGELVDMMQDYRLVADDGISAAVGDAVSERRLESSASQGIDGDITRKELDGQGTTTAD